MTYVLDRSVGNGVIVKPDTYREICDIHRLILLDFLRTMQET